MLPCMLQPFINDWRACQAVAASFGMKWMFVHVAKSENSVPSGSRTTPRFGGFSALPALI
jgi:hypothetical protein